jgi:primosomal replication protein N
MNRLVLSAQLIERGAVRYTPAGLPACDFSLKHESQVTEAGQPRKVSMEMRGVEIGAAGTFAGFLTNQRNGRGTVLHVTEFE